MKRADIDKKYKWDLTKMYENDELWNEEYQKLKNNYHELSKYKGKIMASANNLLKTIKTDLKYSRQIEKLYVYAYMRLDEDTNNTYYQNLVGKIDNLISEIGLESSYIIPELLESDYSLVEKYLKEKPGLKEYKFHLEEIFRYKNHTLSQREEEIIANFHQIIKSPNKTSSLLRNSDLKFGKIKNKNKEEVELTNSNYSLLISSNDREVRKNAFKLLYQKYEEHKNTFASTLAGNMESNCVLSRLKKFNNTRESFLYNHNIDPSIYDDLIDTVNNNLDVIYKYYQLKKEVLNLDELHMYDLYTELVSKSDKKYTFEEGKEIVIKALSVLGKDYIKNIKRAFDENWIDVYSNENKKSGAYSWGCYDSNPYILLNFQGKIDDVSTLAHELGHSMHSFYSHENNPYQYSSYAIFVAEVASTVNELLLANYMLNNSTDKTEKLDILNQILEIYKGTLYRQTMFAEFEKDIYNKKESGEIITYQLLNDIYYELNKKYFGDNVYIDEEIKYEWARIPHFYTSFYVYQYATGLSAAAYIVESILNKKENALENYLEFLKTGGRDYPVSELKIAGVDMNDPKIVESAIKMFDNKIEEFKKIYTK